MEQLARKRAGMKLGFYIHALVFTVVMLVVVAINVLTSAIPWSLAPLLGWGFGFALHGIAVYFRTSDAGLKERLVQAEVKKLKAQAAP